jgi:hypothetical protein
MNRFLVLNFSDCPFRSLNVLKIHVYYMENVYPAPLWSQGINAFCGFFHASAEKDSTEKVPFY